MPREQRERGGINRTTSTVLFALLNTGQITPSKERLAIDDGSLQSEILELPMSKVRLIRHCLVSTPVCGAFASSQV